MRLLVEGLLADGKPVCIIDPKGDRWGTEILPLVSWPPSSRRQLDTSGGESISLSVPEMIDRRRRCGPLKITVSPQRVQIIPHLHIRS
jgi:hypothetical protein